MNKSTKKIIGSAVFIILLATLGAVLVTADTDDTTNDENTILGFEGDRLMGGRQPYFSELTEEQQAEINDLRQQLIEEDATPDKIREAINEKLAEFGIELPDRDELLDKKIEQTTEHLEILELQKQLREEGKSWDEIKEILAEDYNITSPIDHQEMMDVNGVRCMHTHLKGNYSIDSDSEDSEI